ncbi:MAG: spondin domain-containing protein [Bacteroidota bacterium]
MKFSKRSKNLTTLLASLFMIIFLTNCGDDDSEVIPVLSAADSLAIANDFTNEIIQANLDAILDTIPELTGVSESYALNYKVNASNPTTTAFVTFAEAEESGSRYTYVIINSLGGPEGAHPAHIHEGDATSNGDIAVSLDDVMIDTNGVGTSITAVRAFDAGDAVDYSTLIDYNGYINVHYMNDLSMLIAQGDVAGNSLTGNSETYALGSVAIASISGEATIYERKNGYSRVEVKLNGSIPGDHPNHLHLGTAPPANGPIHVSLSHVGADGYGITDVRNLFVSGTDDLASPGGVNTGDPITYTDLLALETYINVHFSDTDLSTLIAQGNTGASVASALQRFKVRITNEVNLLAAQSFNTKVGATEPGPLTAAGDQYQIEFSAFPGTKVSFATMQAMSNDWFFAPDGGGIYLFNGMTPVTGDITDQVKFWDAGTEEENPAFWPTANGGLLDDEAANDADNTVRVIEGKNPSDYITVELGYEEGSNGEHNFTLSITKLSDASVDGFAITPGIVVVHAQDDPLFTEGEPDRGVGLKEIAEVGVPTVLYDYLTEQGTSGDLRLSRSMTPLSPPIALTFSGDTPLFDQGTSTIAAGLEELAEDGGTDELYETLLGLNDVTQVKRADAPLFPGEYYEFYIYARPGDKFSFATMFVQSNDWFFSFGENGEQLWDANGNLRTLGVIPADDATLQLDPNGQFNVWLFDAGTEEDEVVGFGPNQTPRAQNVGPADSNTEVRRIMAYQDLQFGKDNGIINGAGVAHVRDPRGGYNQISVVIEPAN